jgi:DNA-binding XRE family transcriptional regulator
MAKKSYRTLHDQVVAREGAPERLALLRSATLHEIGLNELRRALHQSQVELALELGISQSAVSQIENGEDVKVSTLRTYINGLGAELRIVAVFNAHGEDETAIPIQIGAA